MAHVARWKWPEIGHKRLDSADATKVGTKARNARAVLPPYRKVLTRASHGGRYGSAGSNALKRHSVCSPVGVLDRVALDQAAFCPTGIDRTIFRVLVADDDDGIRNLLTRLLETEGYEVQAVANGRDAISRLRECATDIVLLDVEMPGTTGLDVLGFIREHSLHTAVIISTAYGTEDVAAEALRRGADDYLRKPFDRSDVLAVLDRTMARLLLSRQNALLRERIAEHQRQVDADLVRAAKVVADLMPASPPPISGFGLAAACLSARDVGGDFYDWQELSDKISLTVGDVMGKGLPAALLMASVRAALRAVAADFDPAEVVQRTARALNHDLDRSGAFATLFHAQIDIRTGGVRYVDAGHGYVLLRRADGRVEDLKPWGLPLGIDSREQYQEGCVMLDPGDALIVYSDGLVEARGDLFGTRDAVALHATVGHDAQAIVRRLIDEVREVNPLPDDLTVVVLQRQMVGVSKLGREHVGAAS